MSALEADQGGMGLYVSGAVGLMQSPAEIGESGFQRAELIGQAYADHVLNDHRVTQERFIIGLANMEAGYIYPKMTHEPAEHFSQQHAPGPNVAMAAMVALTALLDEVNGF